MTSPFFIFACSSLLDCKTKRLAFLQNGFDVRNVISGHAVNAISFLSQASVRSFRKVRYGRHPGREQANLERGVVHGA